MSIFSVFFFSVYLGTLASVAQHHAQMKAPNELYNFSLETNLVKVVIG